jgi:hypothetical protein
MHPHNLRIMPMEQDNQSYLDLDYFEFEHNEDVRESIADAFNAVGKHVFRLEARIRKLEKAVGATR